MIELTATEIDELLSRHGIVKVASDHDGLASAGGVVTNISVVRADGEPYFTVMIGEISALDTCPLNQERATALVQRFRGHGLPAGDVRLERMFAHLLLKISELYIESKAVTLRCDHVHLHPTSYHIGKMHLTRVAPLSAKERAPHAQQREAVFTHRHGGSKDFPR